MALQHIGSGIAIVSCPAPIPIQHPVATSPDVDAAKADSSVDERRLRRRVSNRESARRCRARKKLRLHELRCMAARLEGVRRDLASRAQAARGRVAVARLANAELRSEAAALTRRLAAARRALMLHQLYAATTAAGSGLGLGPVDIEQTIASLIA